MCSGCVGPCVATKWSSKSAIGGALLYEYVPLLFRFSDRPQMQVVHDETLNLSRAQKLNLELASCWNAHSDVQSNQTLRIKGPAKLQTHKHGFGKFEAQGSK